MECQPWTAVWSLLGLISIARQACRVCTPPLTPELNSKVALNLSSAQAMREWQNTSLQCVACGDPDKENCAWSANLYKEPQKASPRCGQNLIAFIALPFVFPQVFPDNQFSRKGCGPGSRLYTDPFVLPVSRPTFSTTTTTRNDSVAALVLQFFPYKWPRYTVHVALPRVSRSKELRFGEYRSIWQIIASFLFSVGNRVKLKEGWKEERQDKRSLF